MRFCPFCAQENADDAPECAHCGRKLPQVATRAVAPPARPSTPVLRPPARALPRPRVLHAASALPGTEAVAASPERGRTATMLGIAQIAPPARPAAAPAAPIKDPTPDGATRVDDSPFEAPTTQQATLPSGFDGPESTTAVRPAPSRTVAGRPAVIDDERTEVADEPRNDEGPTAVRPPVSARDSRPIGLKKSNTPTWGVPTSPPPVPLPPPPGGAIPSMREDPPESVTSPGTLLPREVSNDGLADTGDSDEPDVPPMPLPPGPKVMDGVRYLLPLVKAVWARATAQRHLRDKLHGDQRLLDDTLHELGRAAWEEPQRPAELREELSRADEDEARRKRADADIARIDMDLGNERERWNGDETERKADLERRHGEIARLTEDLAERRRGQKTEEKAMRDVDARFRTAEKAATQLVGKAARAEITPPEKGGGPNAAANFRQQAEAAQREADGFRPERDAAEARVRAFDGPITELELKVGEEKQGLTAAEAALQAAGAAHKEAITAFETQRAERAEVSTVAEKNVRLRLVSTGTILSLHRLDGPQHKARFGAIYERLDGLKQISSAREQRMNQLEAERHGYDRAALQRGLIVVGGAVTTLLLMMIIIIVLVSR